MLAESPISLDRVAWSGQPGRSAADSRHHDRDRGRVHLRQTQIVACANSDPSSWPPRNDALGNRSRPPGVRNLSRRAGLKPIRHGPAHWTCSRCGQPKSLTRSLVGWGSPLNDQLTPKALFHQASLRRDRLVRPHGVMSSGDVPRLADVTRVPPANRSVEDVDVPRKLSTPCRQHRGWNIWINAAPASASSAQGLTSMVSASASRTTRAISPRRVAPSVPAQGAALPRLLAAIPSRRLTGTGDG